MLQKCNAIVGGARQVAIIADQAVADLHLQSLIACLPANPLVLTFPPGEASKSLDTVRRLYADLARARIERGAAIVTLGGGVAGDLGGFVAATWLRGVRYVQVPTTLLSAVDASVGGKTGVNLPLGKNLVGAFHQPDAVVIDTDFLQTLSERDFTSGLAESVKHAVVLDPDFLARHEDQADALRTRDENVVVELIARNCEIKAAIVALDEREAGLRVILNHGHTVGHAIEHLLEYRLRHGECVALGMVAENELACDRGLLDPMTARRIRELLSRLGLPTRLSCPIEADDVIQACRLDKKARGGAFNLVLIRQIGEPVQVTDVSEAEVARALRAIQAS
jgi:3-dehydroquinate synthase